MKAARQSCIGRSRNKKSGTAPVTVPDYSDFHISNLKSFHTYPLFMMPTGIPSAPDCCAMEWIEPGNLFHLTVENIQSTPVLRNDIHIQTDPANTPAPVRAINPRIIAIANGCASTVCSGAAAALDDIKHRPPLRIYLLLTLSDAEARRQDVDDDLPARHSDPRPAAQFGIPAHRGSRLLSNSRPFWRSWHKQFLTLA